MQTYAESTTKTTLRTKSDGLRWLKDIIHFPIESSGPKEFKTCKVSRSPSQELTKDPPLETREFYRKDYSDRNTWTLKPNAPIKYDCYTKYYLRTKTHWLRDPVWHSQTGDLPPTSISFISTSTSIGCGYTDWGYFWRLVSETPQGTNRCETRTIVLNKLTPLIHDRHSKETLYCWPSNKNQRVPQTGYMEKKKKKKRLNSDVRKRHHLVLTLTLSKRLRTLRKVT